MVGTGFSVHGLSETLSQVSIHMGSLSGIVQLLRRFLMPAVGPSLSLNKTALS